LVNRRAPTLNLNRSASVHPSGQLAVPDDIAGAVLHLGSFANTNLTGGRRRAVLDHGPLTQPRLAAPIAIVGAQGSTGVVPLAAAEQAWVWAVSCTVGLRRSGRRPALPPSHDVGNRDDAGPGSLRFRVDATPTSA
jgi:hypothetical protein